MVNGVYQVAYTGAKGYYMQLQLGMLCTGLQHSVLVIWGGSESLKLQVPFNQTYVDQHVERLRNFYFSKMLPKVVDDFDQGRLQLCSKYKDLATCSP